MNKNHGFTLVEILVVIAIIMVLIALALPIMRSVSAAAKRAVCASNMRQLYAGFVLYTHDNLNYLPLVDQTSWGDDPSMSTGEVDWIGYWVNVHNIPQGGTIWPYINEAEIYKCPEDTGWRGDYHIWTPEPGVHSYSVPIPREGRQFSPLQSQKALLVGESQTTINDGGFITDWDSIASRHRLSGWGMETRSHAGGNILFCDGRVEFFIAESIVVANDPMFQ